MTTPFTQTYQNGFTRSYSVISANVLSDDAAILSTAGDGDVLIGRIDTPDLWAQLQAYLAGGGG